MQKIISRPLWIQRMFISRFSNIHHELVLYNEKPERSTWFLVHFDDDRNKKHDELDKVKNIGSSNSRTLSSSESNYVVIHTNIDIDIPVIELKVDSEEAPVITYLDIVKWLAKTPDSDNKEPGTKIGRLDAANEAGFFHRADRSRLKEIKKKLKDKVDSGPAEPKKTG